MPKKPAEDAVPVSVDEKAVLLILAELREGGPEGVMKRELRDALAEQAEKDDPDRLPETDEERLRWSRALDKKVERCLRSLEEDGARIQRVKAPVGRMARFVMKKGPTWDEHVTGEALLALKLAALTLSHTGTQLWHEKLGVIEEIASRHMSNRDRKLFEQMEKAVKVYGGVEDPSVLTLDDLLEPLLRAIETERMVAIEYQAAGASKATTKDYAPKALTHDLFSGGAYLLVWDPRSKSPRQLRLNRIHGVKVLKDRAVITQPEKLQRALDYQIGAWVCGDTPFQVVARIWGAGWINSLQEAPPALHGFDYTVEKGGESMIIRFNANIAEGPLRWLLQFGACAEVLEPPMLKDRMREELEEMMKAYPSPK